MVNLRKVAFRYLSAIKRAEHKKAVEQAFLIADRYRGRRCRCSAINASADEKDRK